MTAAPISKQEADATRKKIEEQIVAHYLALDKNGKFLHPPSTDDELDEFIQCAYSCKIPRKVVSPGHRSPFSFVADLFFERVKNALGFANRSGGKTRSVAILNHLDLLFKPKCEIASAGAVLDQADKCYRYFKEFCETKWFLKFCEDYKAKTGVNFVVKDQRSVTLYATGSMIEIITGTEKGLRSPHPHKARLDEIDLMEWSTMQTAFSMARTADGIRGQNVFTSTRQKEEGTMQRMLNTADQKGIAVYEWDIWETVSKCERRCIDDPKHGTCPIYEFCKGKAHHCDGFFSIDDFIDKVRLLDRTSFETEWENKRPARHKQVYWMWDRNRHIMTPQRLMEIAGVPDVSPSWYRVNSIDFGSSPGHPFVYLKIFQIPNVHAWLVYHCYAAEQRLLRDHAKSIKNSPFYLSGELTYADWDAQDRLELASLGIRTTAANKELSPGIDFIGTLLQGFPPYFRPMLYVWHTCEFVISEFGKYSWPILADGKIDKSGSPKKEHDHSMDGVRYALFSYRNKRSSGYRSESVAGL